MALVKSVPNFPPPPYPGVPRQNQTCRQIVWNIVQQLFMTVHGWYQGRAAERKVTVEANYLNVAQRVFRDSSYQPVESYECLFKKYVADSLKEDYAAINCGLLQEINLYLDASCPVDLQIFCRRLVAVSMNAHLLGKFSRNTIDSSTPKNHILERLETALHLTTPFIKKIDRLKYKKQFILFLLIETEDRFYPILKTIIEELGKEQSRQQELFSLSQKIDHEYIYLDALVPDTIKPPSVRWLMKVILNNLLVKSIFRLEGNQIVLERRVVERRHSATFYIGEDGQ